MSERLTRFARSSSPRYSLCCLGKLPSVRRSHLKQELLAQEKSERFQRLHQRRSEGPSKFEPGSIPQSSQCYSGESLYPPQRQPLEELYCRWSPRLILNYSP